MWEPVSIDVLKYILENSEESDFDSNSESEMEELFSSDSSNGESTDSENPRRNLHRITNFMETVDEYDDQEFIEHFRLNRSTCKKIIGMLEADHVLPTHKFGRKKISEKKSFYVTLWYLSNTETFRQISDRFNITKSSAYRTVYRIINYLVSKSQEFVLWPDDQQKEISKTAFKNVKGINGVIGCIDGTHIQIKKPKSEYHYMYYNRKCDYSILLQGVCDHRKKFIDIFCGEAGSIHDSRLLKKSSLYRRGINGCFGDYFLLGDSAYPCLNWLIPPFKDNGNLSENQKIFNYRHSSTRIVIENAFGLLKGRFRRLKIFENENIMFIVKCVIAAVVLHNMCIDWDDTIFIEDEPECDGNDSEVFLTDSEIHQQQAKRNEIFIDMFGN